MIRVLKLSGQELAAVAVGDVEDVGKLKRHLLSLYDLPVCMLQLVQDGCILGDAAVIDAPGAVQLVLVPVSGASQGEAAAALIRASAKGNVETVRLLLRAGANKDLENREGNTALIYACLRGHMEIVRMLLEAGADTELTNKIGDTALTLACAAGRVEIVRSLLDARADKELTGRFGDTALTCACRKLGHFGDRLCVQCAGYPKP